MDVTLYLMIGLLVGVVIAVLGSMLYLKSKNFIDGEQAEMLRSENQQLSIDLKLTQERYATLERESVLLKDSLDKEREKVIDISKNLSVRETDLKNLQQRLQEQKQEVEELQEKFRIQFKNLANEIFEEKSKKFTDQNKTNLTDLLNPLKDKITDFEKKVEQSNKESIDRNAALREQISGLKELNQRITKEAENLTKALKGETKTQGNWGEFILESILEKSGLQKGREYEIQESFTVNDGRRLQPDVVIKLPENKNIVIDSKVSLVAYEKMVNAPDDTERDTHIRSHVNSIRTHIKSLGEKDYQSLYGVSGLDFVLLFMPIEPAFSLAVQQDDQLFNFAYEKNIVIVGPSTLIATLRTISSIWRQEYQNRNATEIARQGGLLYDKFKAFTDDLIKIGENLNMTKKSYELAMNKLSDGKDNLIRKTERLKELGAKVNKSIDQRLLDRSV